MIRETRSPHTHQIHSLIDLLLFGRTTLLVGSRGMIGTTFATALGRLVLVGHDDDDG